MASKKPAVPQRPEERILALEKQLAEARKAVDAQMRRRRELEDQLERSAVTIEALAEMARRDRHIPF